MVSVEALIEAFFIHRCDHTELDFEVLFWFLTDRWETVTMLNLFWHVVLTTRSWTQLSVCNRIFVVLSAGVFRTNVFVTRLHGKGNTPKSLSGLKRWENFKPQLQLILVWTQDHKLVNIISSSLGGGLKQTVTAQCGSAEPWSVSKTSSAGSEKSSDQSWCWQRRGGCFFRSCAGTSYHSIWNISVVNISVGDVCLV